MQEPATTEQGSDHHDLKSEMLLGTASNRLRESLAHVHSRHSLCCRAIAVVEGRLSAAKAAFFLDKDCPILSSNFISSLRHHSSIFTDNCHQIMQTF